MPSLVTKIQRTTRRMQWISGMEARAGGWIQLWCIVVSVILAVKYGVRPDWLTWEIVAWIAVGQTVLTVVTMILRFWFLRLGYRREDLEAEFQRQQSAG